MKVITNDNLRSTIALAALEQVKDPEIGLNVIDLGLVYQLDFDEGNKIIFVTMTLTTSFCPMGEIITTGVRRALESTFTGMEVKVTLTFDPPWTHERISEEGKSFLNS